MALTRARMIDRMTARDPAYDGRFITGVLSTGIYCLPSCKARNPKPENVRFFPDEEKARGAGLRPCKRCRPDDFYARRDPELQRVEEVAVQVAAHPGEIGDVDDLAHRVEVGTSKLHALWRRHLHATPARWLTRCRVEAAQRRLLKSDRPVTQVAYDVGFDSLSSFNANFLRLSGLTPAAYRKLLEADRFEVRLPRRYPRRILLGYLGRDPESPVQRVRDDCYEAGLWLGGVPSRLEARIHADRLEVTLKATAPLPPDAAAQAHRQVLHRFGLIFDPVTFERGVRRQESLAPLVEGRRGLRVPQTASPYDALVWTILGQQVSLPFALQLYRRLARRCGAAAGGGMTTPPVPATVAELDTAALTGLGLSGRKAEYVADLTRRVLSGDLDLDALTAASALRLERTLLEERGLGPWSVNYMMMRGYGFEDCLPVGDAGLARGLIRFFGLAERPGPTETIELMECFRPYRTLATFHLWHLTETEP